MILLDRVRVTGYDTASGGQSDWGHTTSGEINYGCSSAS